MLQLQIGYRTDVGPVRKSNQDSIGVLYQPRLYGEDPLPLVVVADGMGGRNGGEVASSIAVSTMMSHFRDLSAKAAPAAALVEATHAANNAIIKEALKDRSIAQMGTTVVALTAFGQHYFIANVGDSRAYLIHDGEISQITEDHSLMSQETYELASSYLMASRNIITRVLGRERDLEVDLFQGVWEPADQLLLCTDGLWGVLSNGDLVDIVTRLDPEEAANQLIETALDASTSDNASVAVVKRLK
ncbi:MAG: serine/threonine-protein phosphatase [Chloroflexi bacterium]|nr:serine/threonine-protein phosphatase [Chloroflexota bacterium]